jgi:LysR family cyn operon transcriptional activator
MNLMAIELRLLRGFVAIARTGTFLAAAQQLHLTQSALSQQMKELAERLGLTLFERQGRRAVLSDAGRGLVERVGPLIEQLDALLLQSSNAAQRVAGRLRVGATQTYLRSIALPAALELISSHPDLQIDAQQLPAQRLLADLLDGEIDVAIFPETGPHNSLSQAVLLTERLAVIATPEALVSVNETPSLKSLEGCPLALLNRHFLMRQNIDKQARQDKAVLDIRLEVSAMDDLIAAAADGRLLAVGSELACLGNTRIMTRPLKGKFLSRSAVLYWRRDRLLTGNLLAFQAAVKRISGELSGRV